MAVGPAFSDHCVGEQAARSVCTPTHLADLNRATVQMAGASESKTRLQKADILIFCFFFCLFLGGSIRDAESSSEKEGWKPPVGYFYVRLLSCASARMFSAKMLLLIPNAPTHHRGAHPQKPPQRLKH